MRIDYTVSYGKFYTLEACVRKVSNCSVRSWYTKYTLQINVGREGDDKNCDFDFDSSSFSFSFSISTRVVGVGNFLMPKTSWHNFQQFDTKIYG